MQAAGSASCPAVPELQAHDLLPALCCLTAEAALMTAVSELLVLLQTLADPSSP